MTAAGDDATSRGSRGAVPAANGQIGDFAAAARVLAESVSNGLIPDAVAAVGTSDRERWIGVAGASDPTGARALHDDSRFRLASMTKLITAVAVMQLVDDGLIDLDIPVATVLPEFGELLVLDEIRDGGLQLRPPLRQATVRQMLAHTSGLSYEVWNGDVLAYQRMTGTPGIASGLRAVLGTPLVDDPGARVEYGTGLDWAGVLVEALTGLSLDEVCARRIFGPLGMWSTSMERMPGRDHVPVLSWSADHFEVTDIDYPQQPEFRTGGGCVWTTADDFLRLLRMLLGAGSLDGVSILREQSVREILSNQTGKLEVPVLRSHFPELSADVDLGPGRHWGLGLIVNSVAEPGLRSAGSGGWWGIFNSTFWIDRTADVAAVLMMQFVPFYCSGAKQTARDFEAAVYGALGRQR